MLCVGSNTVEVKASNGIDASKVYGVEMFWNNSMAVNDVTVSKDGNYIAAVNDTGLYYFALNNSNPKWWYLPQLNTSFMSVRVSADGEYVVAGTSDTYLYYFNDSRVRSGRQIFSTWSTNVGDSVEKEMLDMSDNGEYVVVRARDGVADLYYFAGCRGRSGTSEAPTWHNSFNVIDFRAVLISSDGRYVAVAATNYTKGNFVYFYKDANVTPYPTNPSWIATTSLNTPIGDLALSDDGYAVVAVDEYVALYYWANATALSGMLWPNATWMNPGIFWRVDISDDGSNVVTASSVHFWANARERQRNQTEDWVKLESVGVWDVAISEDGRIIAAPTGAETYFFKSDGSIIGKFNLPQCCFFVSMSGNGSIIAVGNYIHHGLYVFKTLEDSTPPLIEDVYQQPANDIVFPDDEVMVYANVTDDQSGVKHVILSYTTDNETWFISNMTNLEGNKWNATIRAFPYCTNVRYMIIAEDYANNTITTEEMGYTYQYHVIPEFPSLIIPPLFIIATLLAVIVYRRKNSR